MGFKTDRMSAQDRILNQFDRVLKNEKWKEKNDLKSQLENVPPPPPKRKVYDDDKPVYLPLYAMKYKIEDRIAKEEAKSAAKKKQ